MQEIWKQHNEWYFKRERGVSGSISQHIRSQVDERLAMLPISVMVEFLALLGVLDYTTRRGV